MTTIEVRYARAALASLYAGLPPGTGLPMSIETAAQLAWVSRRWAQQTVASYHSEEITADDARTASLVLRAAKAGALEALAAQVVNGEAVGDPLVLWLTLFSARRTRGIIRELQKLVQHQCRGQLEQLRSLDRRIESAERDGRRMRKEAVTHDEMGVELLRNRSLDIEDRAARSADHRAMAVDLRKRASACRKMAKRLRSERSEMWNERPTTSELKAVVRGVLEAWTARNAQRVAAGEPPRALSEPLADVAQALRSAPETCETVITHALTWLWRGTPPKRWLLNVGYRAAKVQRQVEPIVRYRAERRRGFDPVLPKGTELVGLRDDDLTAAEMQALRASRTARKKQLERKLDAWLVAVMWLALNDEAELQELYARQAVWRQNGWEGRQQERKYLLRRGALYSKQKRLYREDLSDLADPFAIDPDGDAPTYKVRPLPPRPRIPEMVAFRWPPDGPMRYGEVGENLSVLRDPEPVLDLPPEPVLLPAPGPAPVLPPPEPKQKRRTRKKTAHVETFTTLLPGKLCVLDTETTGVLKKSEVHEIGAHIVDADGNILDSFSGEGRPKNLRLYRIHEALAVSGLTVRDLARRTRTTAEVIAAFDDWLTKHGRPPCVAYNQSFDRRLLRQSGLDGLVWGEDVMAVAKRALGLKSCKLQVAIEQLGVDDVPQNHRAIDDARQTVGVLLAAHRKLKVQQ